MIVNSQRSIIFNNTCGCLVDYSLLEKAMLWYTDKPIARLHKIYIHSRYPTVSIHHEKLKVHRLLMMYKLKQKIINGVCHHIDGNILNSQLSNLEILSHSDHAVLHNAGKKLTEVHRKKISVANRKRNGIPHKYKLDLDMNEIIKMRSMGMTMVQIGTVLGCDHATIARRIHDQKEDV